MIIFWENAASEGISGKDVKQSGNSGRNAYLASVCLLFFVWWMHWDTSSYGTDGTKKQQKKQSAEKHSGFTEATVEVLRDQVLLLGCQRHQRRAVFYGPVASRSDLSPPLVLDVLEPRNIGTTQHTASSIAPPAATIQSMLKPPPHSQLQSIRYSTQEDFEGYAAHVHS